MLEYRLGFSKDEIVALFKEFDTDGSGSICYEEFLIKLRVKNKLNFSFIDFLKFLIKSHPCRKEELIL